ncbi:unnamed protein product [Meloidogyne enterolobii]|uniref:Uncharacterized protein n=2 Tax=Meloidogyne enterolobii TaxID=390850 RepID=A0A6V7Y9S4_MELEN|nr:unnamed protein product [Meloidogyne enterolobii]
MKKCSKNQLNGNKKSALQLENKKGTQLKSLLFYKVFDWIVIKPLLTFIANYPNFTSLCFPSIYQKFFCTHVKQPITLSFST